MPTEAGSDLGAVRWDLCCSAPIHTCWCASCVVQLLGLVLLMRQQAQTEQTQWGKEYPESSTLLSPVTPVAFATPAVAGHEP